MDEGAVIKTLTFQQLLDFKDETWLHVTDN